jgi:dephospho-CoA kinase
MNMIIGLTGKYCVGKNYIASLLEARGLPVIDVDKVGYQVLETEKEAIFARFGEDLKRADGSLDRRLLGQKVFGVPEELAALEGIVHPPVNCIVDEWVAANTAAGKHSVINAALLHRAAAFDRLDRIILVKASLFTRILRARRRDGLSLPVIIKRFASQKNFYSQYLASNAEIYIVENPGQSGSRDLKLERRIDKILEGIL